MKKIISLLIFSVCISNIFCQDSKKENATTVYDKGFLLAPTFTFQVPGSEMAHRYGVNSNFGMQVGYKFGKNLMVGLEGNFLFGSKIKEGDHLIHNLVVSNLVIASDGALEEANFSGRGTMARLLFGKSFPFNLDKPSSGLLIQFGAGYMRHRILIDVNNDLTPQFTGDYKGGYDRLTHGLALSQYVGILKLEKGKYVNLSLGLEFIQGITRSARPFDFIEGKKLDKTRFEALYGLKLTWIIPAFTGQSTKSEYYYY